MAWPRIKFASPFHIVLQFVLGLVVFTTPCFGWGHSKGLNEEWGKATLTEAITRRGQISYCIDSVDHDRFPPKVISKQLFKALRVWLQGTSYSNVPIVERYCTQRVDLRVVLDAEQSFPELSAYEIPKVSDEHYYSFIKINSDYVYKEDSQSYQVQDFARVLPTPLLLSRALGAVSVTEKLNVVAASQKYGVPYQKLYFSTYKMLLHELGHAFGLCDTTVEQRSECDPKFSSSVHPPSVMNGADYFYLTEDDRAGVAAVFRRYENPAD